MNIEQEFVDIKCLLIGFYDKDYEESLMDAVVKLDKLKTEVVKKLTI